MTVFQQKPKEWTTTETTVMLSLFLSSLSPATTTTITVSLLSFFSSKRIITTLSSSIYTLTSTTAMSITKLHQAHAFAGNPIRSTKTPKSNSPFSPSSALESLKTQLKTQPIVDVSHPDFKVLPFRKGRPLASSQSKSPSIDDDVGDLKVPFWHLGWIDLGDLRSLLENYSSEISEDSFVYLGFEDDTVYWAVDLSCEGSLVSEFISKSLCFVELRTLMVATDWADEKAMSELAIAGHARALLEWHNTSRFCGHCGEKTVPKEAGRRKQCSGELCNKRVYPRVDPVVIMLVIDKENDRALLSRQSRFVPRMWSCLAGFIELGESLEEAVRRETWEETGIEVGEVIYHSSQPWPVGPNSMPCQLMVGFFAYAKSLDINVDKEELEDAQWHTREEVSKALAFAEYKKAQQTAAAKVDQMCRGVEKGQNLSGDFNLESGELAPMFIPGPFSIAHHLISSWVNQGSSVGLEAQVRQLSTSMSNL